MSQNTTETIPAPAGTTAQPWEEDEGRIYRIISREHTVRPDITLNLYGNQVLGGQIEPDSVHIFVEARNELTPADARELAAALLAAADELDGWRAFSEDDWLALAGQLTPAQMKHLRASERLARQRLNHPQPETRAEAQLLLDGLHAEAQFYASRNAEPGVEPDTTTAFRDLVRSVDHTEITTEDTLALLSLLQRVMDHRGC